MNYSLAILTAFALLPHAAWSGGADTADPADPAAQVPSFRYESAFRGYMRDSDVAVGDWRATAFDAQTPHANAMRRMDMPPGPAPAAQAPDALRRSDGGAAPAHGMRHKHKM